MQAVGKAARKVLNPGGGNYENVRVENIDHFIDYFRQTATHVYIPRPAYDHHFLIKSAKFYEASQVMELPSVQIVRNPGVCNQVALYQLNSGLGRKTIHFEE